MPIGVRPDRFAFYKNLCYNKNEKDSLGAVLDGQKGMQDRKPIPKAQNTSLRQDIHFLAQLGDFY